MTRDPEDGCGDADPTHDLAGRSGEDHTPDTPGSDDEFDRIVAAWRDEGSVPTWPDAEPRAAGPGASTAEHPAAAPPPTPAEATAEPPVHRPGPTETPSDDDHFHPPEPPPLPRPGPPALVGAVLIGLGLLLVAVPETLGMSSLYGLPLGLVGIAAGLTWLVMRMWPSEDADDPGDDDGDDGAVL